MNYRTLGRTGLRVSTLGFGGAPLGSVYGPTSQTESTAAVRTALDLGINFFDTSPYYGLTTAETALGQALAGVPRDRYLLATKVGRYGANDFDFSAARVTRSVDESLARLGCGHIDLIQVHDLEFTRLEQIWTETLPALERLRASGKVRFVGITGLPLRALTEVLAHHTCDTVLSYCHYSLNDTTLASAAPAWRATGAGVIHASPLAMGLLSDGGPPAWHPAPAALKQACAAAAAHCAARGRRLGDTALQFAFLPDAPADTTFVGMRSVDEVRRNAALVATAPDLEFIAELRALLAPVHDLTWPSGLPENN
jgi:L-galactose dehydrogenase